MCYCINLFLYIIFLIFFFSNFYFADWDQEDGNKNSKIYMANMDGSEMQAVVSEKIIKPGALCVDFANDHLYFADMSLNVIERVNLDGSNRRLIAIGLAVSIHWYLC